MMVDLGIVGSAKFGRDHKISQENTYNMFVSEGSLVCFPGYRIAQSFPGKQIRGFYVSNNPNVIIVVVDDVVYQLDNSLTYTIVGSINTSRGAVFISSNKASPVQFCISDLSELYIYTYNTGVTIVTKPYSSFLPGYMDYQNGYFITADRNSDKWSISHLQDGTNWEILDSSTGLTYQGAFGAKADNCQAAVVFKDQVFVMGENSSEIWLPSGNVLFPYQRNNSIALDYGVISLESIAEGFGLLVWLGKNEFTNPTLVMSTGGEPIPILDDGIEFIIDNLEYPQFSSGFLYKDGSHTFYQITFYRDNLTLSYDFLEKRFYTLIDENYNHHRAAKMLQFNNKSYFVGFPQQENDGENNVYLYEFDSRYTTYNGRNIPRIRVCPPIRKPDTGRYKIPQVILNMNAGTSRALQTVAIAKSDNGGISFGDYYHQNVNPYGLGSNKMVFRQLGAANETTFKFAFWAGNPDETYDNLPTEDGTLARNFTVVGGQVEVV